VIVGEHYPGDVLMGAAIGTASALAVVRLARPVVGVAVRGVERVTDPLLRPLWRGNRSPSA
jgi:membrane-associated phospholipid phosphatase